MPTTRPRHLVTETDELAAALADAARLWPDLSRSQLLVRLALKGHAAALAAQDERVRRRRDAVHAHSGTLTGAYGSGVRERLRDDWPR